jgi:phosphoribosylformimino-5-aminoimidazole carboxamide ribotide isomerase
MILFPAMDLFGQNVVKLEAKAHREVETIYGTPEAVAERWLAAGAEWLHVVDLEAALGTGKDHRSVLPLLRKQAQARGARLQWGGGIRDDESLQVVLGQGADRAIVGTQAIRDWEWLVQASGRHPGRILVSIDGRGREVLVAGWQERSAIDAVEFLRRSEALPLAGYLYTNVAVEGRGKGVDWEPVGEVLAAARKPVVVSGGVSSLADVARFKDLGAYGIIAGSALYQGRFEFGPAQALAR